MGNWLLEVLALSLASELDWLKKKDQNIIWIYKNGYLFIDKYSLEKINNILKIKKNKEIAINLIKTASHTKMGIIGSNMHINHVLCSGLPINYQNDKNQNQELWKLLSEVFLKAYYRNTLLIACENNRMSKKYNYSY